MAGWRNALVGVGAALVTSAVGVAVNLATDWRTNLVAWGAVVGLSVVAGLVATWAVPAARSAGRDSESHPAPPGRAADPAAVDGDGNVRNTISGTVHGSVVQARTVEGGVHQYGPPPSRNGRR